MVALRDDITAAMKTAMKARDTKRLGTLRLILAAIKDRDIASRTEDSRTGISDAEILALFGKLIKSREDSIALYNQGHRPELAAAEEAEIAIIREFMPKPMTEAETDAAVAAAISETGAAALKDMGKVMGALKVKCAGRMDFSKVGPLVKAKLAAK